MQLIAINNQDERIVAFQAQKKIDYRCAACSCVVRLRCGPRIQAHFYHYNKREPCKQRKKTLAHLNNQLHLVSKLPPNEAILEHPFPTIGRIADVFWPSQNLVFEIQYSPMSLAEAEKREFDYTSLGLHLVWILHDIRYNRRHLTAAEQFFVTRNTYYTSIVTQGSGMIYDQFEIIRDNQRHFKGARFQIHPSSPYLLQNIVPPAQFPGIFLDRLKTRTLGFTGDVIDETRKKIQYDYSSLIALEKHFSKKTFSYFSWWPSFTAAYRAFLYALLEKILMT